MPGMPVNQVQPYSQTDDQMWLDVIQQMENTYAELVSYQVELEEKNAKLENAQLFIQSVLSSISDALIVCDINGIIIQVNEALVATIGKPADSVVGKPMDSLIADSNKTMITEFPEHIRSGSIIDCEVDFLDNAGKPVPMAINCSARVDHENRLSGFVITGRPLGELRKAYSDLKQAHEALKNAQQQLVQSEKLASLGRLVAGVAHELNNPISFLYANMHALQGYEKNFKAYLDAIHRNISTEARDKLRQELGIDRMLDDITPLVEGSLESAERVTDIVQNLRRFSTPKETKKDHFDVIRVIARATSWVMKAAPQKPLIVTNFPDSLTLYNSEGHVHQILINLLQNAVDAIVGIQHPQIDMRIQQHDEHIDINIRDNGPGIADADIIRIFDPFYTTKDVGSGTGLGLYISYRLATEQCQGGLKAFSHPDGGAEFVLTLPLDTSSEASG